MTKIRLNFSTDTVTVETKVSNYRIFEISRCCHIYVATCIEFTLYAPTM